MPERDPAPAYVFGYGSLVAMREPLEIAGGEVLSPVPGWLRGFHRLWGVAMNNWEAVPPGKHFVDPSGRAPRVRVAFLDMEERTESAVNGLAIPVDATRLADLDAREVNYLRIDVSSAFEPQLKGRVYTYLGKAEARARCRASCPDAGIFVSSAYLTGVRRAFADLEPGSLTEFERTTVPLPFPLLDLELVQPEGSSGEHPGPADG